MSMNPAAQMLLDALVQEHENYSTVMATMESASGAKYTDWKAGIKVVEDFDVDLSDADNIARTSDSAVDLVSLLAKLAELTKVANDNLRTVFFTETKVELPDGVTPEKLAEQYAQILNLFGTLRHMSNNGLADFDEVVRVIPTNERTVRAGAKAIHYGGPKPPVKRTYTKTSDAAAVRSNSRKVLLNIDGENIAEGNLGEQIRTHFKMTVPEFRAMWVRAHGEASWGKPGKTVPVVNDDGKRQTVGFYNV